MVLHLEVCTPTRQRKPEGARTCHDAHGKSARVMCPVRFAASVSTSSPHSASVIGLNSERIAGGSELASRWAAPRKTAGSLPSASILTRLGRLPTSAQNVSRGIASAHVNRWSARRFRRGVTCASREFLSDQLNCTKPEESSTAAGIGLTLAVRPSRETEYASFAKVSGTGSNA